MIWHLRSSLVARIALVVLMPLTLQRSLSAEEALEARDSSVPRIDVLWHAGAIGIFDREARDTFAVL